MKRWICMAGLLMTMGLSAQSASALINPAVQPKHLYDQHQHVLALRVESVDSRNLSIDLSVIGAAKGGLELEKMTLKAESRERLASVLAVQQGQMVVMYAANRALRGGQRDVMYYVGGGQWHKARMAADPKDPVWELLGNADEGKDPSSADIMFGVFNGAIEQLWAMSLDNAANRLYFPARPFTRFTAESLLKLEEPARGVALFDINGDGRLDIVLASPGGSRVLIQNDHGGFEDRTEAWGLKDARANSVALADVNANGSIDLLLDDVLYLQRDGRWHRTELIPPQENIVSAAFVELTGDGYPDVLVSKDAGGLVALANPFGQKDGESVGFRDITRKLGLDQESHGAGGSGYFEIGDWNGDGRSDILYLAGPGYLLLAGDEGFESHAIGDPDDPPAYATAAMAPIAHPTRSAALVLTGDTKMLLEKDEDIWRDITRYGNEIQDDVPGLAMVVAEDLNADGTVDFYAAPNTAGSTAFFCTNRGYGSFMLEEKYNAGRVIPPQVYNVPVHGLAAGDVSGDGANDLLLSGTDGTVWLLRNQTVADRPAQPVQSTLWDERKQIEARLVTVRVAGPRGVVGAQLRLTDSDGRVIGSRQIGSNVGIGSAGPQQVIFAAREPGSHTVHVRYADGVVVEQPVNLAADQPRHQVVTVRRASVP